MSKCVVFVSSLSGCVSIVMSICNCPYKIKIKNKKIAYWVMNEKQCTVTRKKSTAVACDQRCSDVVAGISARFSKFASVLFCFITNHLMTGPLNNSFVTGNKIHCTPRDQSLSVKVAENSFQYF